VGKFNSSLHAFDDAVVLLGSVILTLSIALRFHLMTGEEPSLEMLWLKNMRILDNVQITDPSREI
jgi:hypothetical protein